MNQNQGLYFYSFFWNILFHIKTYHITINLIFPLLELIILMYIGIRKKGQSVRLYNFYRNVMKRKSTSLMPDIMQASWEYSIIITKGMAGCTMTAILSKAKIPE